MLSETEGYILTEYWQGLLQNTEVIINDISSIAPISDEVYQLIKRQGATACLQVPFTDRKGHKCILSFEAVNKKHVWNTERLHYFRLMAKVLSEYTLV